MHSTLTPPTTAGSPRSPAPFVSVIIAYYKQERFLSETIESVRQQTYQNFEIIVVDDGSPVPAASVIAEDSQLRIYRTANHGCPAARNFGFRKSSGEMLVFLDSDDRLTPPALELHLQGFAQNPAAALSFGAQRIIDEEGRELRPAHTCRPRKDYFLKLLEGNPIGTPGATMIRRDAFLEAGLFNETLRIVEDYPLYLRIARKHPLVHSSMCVIDYRFHKKSMSQDKQEMLQGILRTLDEFEAETALSPLERKQLRRGRARWQHEFRRDNTLAYRIRGYCYRFRAMLDLPLGFTSVFRILVRHLD